MFRLFKRLFGNRAEQETPAPEPLDTEAGDTERDDGMESVGAKICGPPEAGTPIVLVNQNDMLMIMDRMAYEYQQGMTPGETHHAIRSMLSSEGPTAYEPWTGGCTGKTASG